MEFEKPNKLGFTIYSKSGCSFCLKAKAVLKEKNLLFNIIDCDEYILEDKPSFLAFINEMSDKEVTSFPIIFYECKFIGGYSEIIHFIDKLLLSFDENLNF
jgi:glutaredoxin